MVKAQVFEMMEAGQYGGIYDAGTSAKTGNVWKIEALEDTVIAALTIANVTGTLTSITLNAGCSIKGKITGWTLTSGSVMAYTDPESYS